jgi:hypothetical protein
MKSPQKLFENSRRYFIIIIYLLKKMKLKNLIPKRKLEVSSLGHGFFALKLFFRLYKDNRNNCVFKNF